MLDRIVKALQRCKPYVLSIFLTYLLSSSAGMLMVHGGNTFALAQRDKIVRKALTSNKSAIAYHSGNRAAAVVLDFAGNLFLVAIPQSVGGLGVVPPYFSVAHQGWVGGIVSVDSAHRSRLRSIKGASYYLLVLLLQFIPFSLSIGAGVRCGMELYQHNPDIRWRFWRYRFSHESIVDVGCVYAVAIPLFFVASAFEFLSPWNV